MKHIKSYILAGLCLAFLAACLIVPILLGIRQGFVREGHWSLYWLTEILFHDNVPHLLFNAGKVALLTTIFVCVLAVPLAVLTQFNFRGKTLLSALLLVPMVLPPFVGAMAMEQLLAHQGGSINLILAGMGLPKIDWLSGGLGAVVLLETLHLYPIMFLNVSAALANVDPTLTEASRNLGASRWRTFWTVTFPLIRPGLFAGATIVFIWSFTELGTPQMLHYNDVLPVRIYDAIESNDVSGKVFAMVFLMLSASVGLYGIGKVLFGRVVGAGGGRGVGAQSRRLGTLATGGAWLAFALVTLVALLPHVGVVLKAFATHWSDSILPEGYTLRHFATVLNRADTWNSVVNSLYYASAATVIDIALGLAVAWLLVRSVVKGKSLLDGLSMLPLAVPGLVIATGFVALTAVPPDVPYLKEFLEANNPRTNPTLILIIAYSVRRLPYMVRSLTAGWQQTPVALEEAARNLGSGPVGSVLRITVPLIMANVVAGAILTFSFAMLEVSDSLILAQTSQYYPITKQIFTMRGAGETEYVACAMGALAMGLLTLTLVGASLLLGKRLGAMFRV